jgi:hypothetical protein
MIWNTVSNEERLRLWKSLREEILTLPLKDQLEEIAKFCSRMPFGARTIDYYSPMEWPTPWEILFHGSFCTSSISLLMFHTLILLNTQYTIELYLVEDTEGIYLLPVIDNQFVLNFELSAVNNYSEIKDKFKILDKYRKEQIKKII